MACHRDLPWRLRQPLGLWGSCSPVSQALTSFAALSGSSPLSKEPSRLLGLRDMIRNRPAAGPPGRQSC